MLCDRKDALGTVGEVPLNRCVSILGSVPLPTDSLLRVLRLSGLIEHFVPLKHVACGLFDQVLLHALKELLGLWFAECFGDGIPVQTQVMSNPPELHATQNQIKNLQVSQLLLRTQGTLPGYGPK